jgi:EpsI family protein
MLSASALALGMRPTQKIAALGPAVDLGTIIPREFGDWREEQHNFVQMVDPQQKELIDKIYTQTLSRTYVNSKGYRIMLAIAYGDDQRDSMQIHYPEVCYPAQGFLLKNKQKGDLVTENGAIPVVRLLTSLGQRDEPVTYWTLVGGTVFQGGVQKKIAEMRYGLNGKIPDGMLIRISSIDSHAEAAYEIQAKFANEMLTALMPEHRQRIYGDL